MLTIRVEDVPHSGVDAAFAVEEAEKGEVIGEDAPFDELGFGEELGGNG